MIVVDTNVLYALADRRDKHHAECTEWFGECDDVLLVPPTVLAEACYLIDKFLGAEAEAAFLDSVGSGPDYPFRLAELAGSDLRRMAELVRRYADRHLGGTDASVIAVCERLAIVTVATVNLRDFANVRPRHVSALTIVPYPDRRWASGRAPAPCFAKRFLAWSAAVLARRASPVVFQPVPA